MLDFNSSEIIVVRFRIHHLHGAEPTKDVISMLVYIFPFAPSVSFDSAPIFKSSILPIGDEFFIIRTSRCFVSFILIFS